MLQYRFHFFLFEIDDGCDGFFVLRSLSLSLSLLFYGAALCCAALCCMSSTGQDSVAVYSCQFPLPLKVLPKIGIDGWLAAGEDFSPPPSLVLFVDDDIF